MGWGCCCYILTTDYDLHRFIVKFQNFVPNSLNIKLYCPQSAQKRFSLIYQINTPFTFTINLLEKHSARGFVIV